jgi:ubiquitin carboxyl-terminal hydrolase 4/11/15
MLVKDLLRLVYEYACESSQSFAKMDFDEYFGTIENPIDHKEWPFEMEVGDQNFLESFYDGEHADLGHYEVITLYIRDPSLRKSENFGGKLAISSHKVFSSLSIYDCFSSFTKNEVLDRDNTWYCKQCKDHKQANKKMELSKLPKVLIIHLKRFSRSKWSFSKNTTTVDFPLKGLDLSKFMVDGAQCGKYNLYGVINHMGGMGGGHYIAYVKTPAYQNLWVEFDDSSVNKISKNDVVTKMAYVLFYRLDEEED